MNKKLLLTSFTTWLPHQKSNSSDDLLQEISGFSDLFLSLNFLRLLPVDTELASRCVIEEIERILPDAIVCCGMAESRYQLSVESNATSGDTILKTTFDLERLLVGVNGIEISHNAGKFVCEGLYYSVLQYIIERQLNSHCIFIHVPILTEENLASVVKDFVPLLRRIESACH